MARAGRRPGGVDTRAEIVAAAGQAFAELGYDRASIRGIAKRAGVDPALVHHYFADKAALFVETMQLPMDPHQVQAEVMGDGRPFSGERLVERFLAQWETGPPGAAPTAFITLVQAIAASPHTADTVREFLSRRIVPPGAPGEGVALQQRRRALISSQLLGLAWTRYIMRLEPVASAERTVVARWAGPTIDRYAFGDLGPADDPGPPTAPPPQPGADTR
jgi:AcrR family transcriptional regulator